MNVSIFGIKIELIFDEDEAFYQSEISSSDLKFLFWFFTNYMKCECNTAFKNPYWNQY
jgi:hypothetical protein